MINCFQRVSQTHNLSIITSIHQPNLEILMKFDRLYVLAKGGVSIFSGRPQQLRNHLSECQITCSEHQIPIEILMKIGANGYTDQTVIRLSDKTNEKLKNFDKRVNKELKLYPNGIPLKTKRFSFEELKHLSIRSLIYTLRYNWFFVSAFIAIEVISSVFLIIIFDMDLESADSCVDISGNVTTGCLRDGQKLQDLKSLQYNTLFLSVGFSFPVLLCFVYTCFTFSNEVKLFTNEIKNSKFKFKYLSCSFNIYDRLV